MTVKVTLDMGRLAALGVNAKAAADRATEASARAIQAGFMHRAPVDTGADRASCTVTNEGEAQRRIGPTVDYAIFQELGTRHNRAQPALKPAFDAEVPHYVAALEKIAG